MVMRALDDDVDDNNNDDLDSIQPTPQSRFSALAYRGPCKKHQQKIPYPEGESPCQGCRMMMMMM